MMNKVYQMICGASLIVCYLANVMVADAGIGLHFTGAAEADLATYEPATGSWLIRSIDGAVEYDIPWGWNEAHPVPGDYNGNGVGDLAVYHRGSGTWFIRTVGGEEIAWGVQWGHSRAHAVASGDYNGDGRSDLAVFDPLLAKWYILSLTSGIIAWDVSWGWGSAQIVPGDYNGDGRTDLALFDRRSGLWYILSLSGDVLAWAVPWGWSETRPVAGDFNGDGRADLAVFHRATGRWFIRSLSGDIIAWEVPWGWNGARALSGDFNGDGRSDLAIYGPSTSEWYVRSLSGETITFGSRLGHADNVPVAHYGTGAEGHIVVALGDSITYGRGSSTDGPLTSYPHFLDQRLETAIGGFGYVINAGIPGETTVRGRQRLPALIDQHNPTVVLLMEGTNDMFAQYEGNQIIGNLTWMAQYVRTRNVSMVMAPLAPLVNRPFRNREAQHQRVIRVNPEIRALAPRMGWPLAETYFTITSKPNWQNTIFNSNQSIHPNDEGYRIYRDEFLGAIRRGMDQGLFIY